MAARPRDKGQWIKHYASQIFRQYMRLQPPLGISIAYKRQIEHDLESFYSEPLKREWIEMTY